MKIPHLLASFAAAVTAVAAELKDPVAVAAEWSRKIGEASAPPLPQNPIGLSATPAVPPSSQPPATTPTFKQHRNGGVLELPPGLYSDKEFRVMVPDGDKIPPGAKPWVYQGKTYWLIPIASTAK